VATLLRIAADHSLEAHLESLAADLNPPRDPSSQAVHPERIGGAGDRSVVLTRWLGMLQQNQTALARLAQQIEAATVAEPTGSHDSLVEYDRKRSAREHLIHAVIATQTESGAAISRLLCALPASLEEGSLADWERYAVSVERALPRGESESIRGLLAPLLESLHNQPLLYRRLDKGGEASKIVAARGVQRTLRMLVESLPRAGMIRESYRVLQTAQQMERDHSVGEGITEFDHLARNALRAIVESVVQASQSWTPFEQSEIPLLECLEKITQPFMRIWLEHSQNLRLTALDRVADDDDWDELRKFIESYGRDLLTPVFLTLGNLRGILDHGAGYYLDYLIENPDPLHPVKLIESLDGKISRTTAERYLDLVMQVFVENYEEYKDYNATTTQSDYGDRFFILFEFLRVKAWYIRASWNLQPVAVVHEALARQGKPVAARLWCEALSEKTGTLADELLERVAALESQYGVRLATVRDLLAERFNRPLALDRVRLLIGPAMKAARTGNGGTTSKLEQGNLAEHESPVAAETKQAQMSPFDQFCEALRDFASTTSGVGLDVPPWLQVLEDTVHDERDPERASIESLQDTSTLRRARFSRKHVDSELDEWDDA
jgi:hypothetical protein